MEHAAPGVDHLPPLPGAPPPAGPPPGKRFHFHLNFNRFEAILFQIDESFQN